MIIIIITITFILRLMITIIMRIILINTLVFYAYIHVKICQIK